jgi:predicted TIM-barrel fold metal-dependent hydrolase
MKLSAVPSQNEYPHRDVRPVVRQLADAYGADRLIYGGGFGAVATAASYRAARERVRTLVAHFSAADQAKVLGGNAAALFKFNA